MVDKFPFVLFFKDNKIYRYEGNLDVSSLLEFLSADNYLEAKITVSDLQEYTA